MTDSKQLRAEDATDNMAEDLNVLRALQHNVNRSKGMADLKAQLDCWNDSDLADYATSEMVRRVLVDARELGNNIERALAALEVCDG